MKESRALLSPGLASEGALKCIQNTEHINLAFLDSLSDTEALSEAESIYAWIYVHTGDTILALEQAKLNVGLIKGDRKSRNSYDKALLVRSFYLNSKPNIAAYIKELRERKYIDTDITKQSVMLEYKEQLDQLKQHPEKNRREILRVLEAMGKSVGLFIDRIEVGKVDHNKAFDQMLRAMELKQQQTKDVEVFDITDTRQLT